MLDNIKGSRSTSHDAAVVLEEKGTWGNRKKWWHIGNSRWVVAIIFVFMVLIPELYVWTASIPDNNNLRIDSGVLSSRRTSSSGELTELVTQNGTIVLTCRSRIRLNHDCYFNSELRNNLVGKSVTVAWYEQPIYLFSTQNRLVELRIGDRVALSRVKTESDFRKASLWGIFEAIVLIIFCIAVCWFLPFKTK